MHIKKLVMVTLMLWLGTTLTWANPQEKNELYLVTDFTYSSNDLGSIEKNILEANSILTKYGFPFSHTLQISDDNKVTYFYKLSSYDEFDALTNFWNDFALKGGEDFNRFLAACGGVVSAFSSTWSLRQDLSYASTNKPLTVGLNAAENYTTRTFYYFKTTEQRRAEGFFQNLKRLYQERRIPGEYRIFQSSLGAERLCFIVEHPYEKNPNIKSRLKSAARAINLNTIPNWSSFDAGGQKNYRELLASVSNVLKKTEVKTAQWHPELYLKAPNFQGQWRTANPKPIGTAGSN